MLKLIAFLFAPHIAILLSYINLIFRNILSCLLITLIEFISVGVIVDSLA